MNTHQKELSPIRIDLSLELCSANGASVEFHEIDAERIQKTLHLLAAPRLFAQPHLLLASQRSASIMPCKGIDMIFAHTSATLPIKFPLDLPAGQFDILEQRNAWPEHESAATGVQERQRAQPQRRISQLEIHTLGGWTVNLKAAAIFHGNVEDERYFFSQLPNMPTIPFRLERGGFGLINTANIVRAGTWPKPDALPATALPLELRR